MGWAVVGRWGGTVCVRGEREESSLTIFAGVVLTVFCASANFEACRPGNFREIFITWNRIYTMDVSRVLWMERDTRFLIFRKNFFFFSLLEIVFWTIRLEKYFLFSLILG